MSVSASLDQCRALTVYHPGYWKGLASSVSFPGKTLEQCLEVIHGDIVAIWSFEDPHKVRSFSWGSRDFVLRYASCSTYIAKSLKP